MQRELRYVIVDDAVMGFEWMALEMCDEVLVVLRASASLESRREAMVHGMQLQAVEKPLVAV